MGSVTMIAGELALAIARPFNQCYTRSTKITKTKALELN